MAFVKKIKSVKRRWLLLAAAVGVVALLIFGRPEKEDSGIALDFDPETTPTMFTRDANSLVSDSGYVKYLIKAPVWYVFNEAAEPNWKFNKGVYTEQYDRDMNIVSTFVADSAIYLSQKKLWEFIGNVRMNNVNGDRFATQLLYWNERQRKIYSDSFIHIERSDRVIEGYGFESDDRIENYTVNRPTMIIPVSDFNRDHQADSTSQTASRPPATGPASVTPSTATRHQAVDSRQPAPVATSPRAMEATKVERRAITSPR